MAVHGGERLRIPGPVGPLEGIWEGAGQQAGPLARCVTVIAHPHPLYGGTMRNAVVDAVAQRVVAAGGSSLRFNFRGVGESAGRHDGGEGERADLGAALAEARRRAPDAVLWVAGYSFGAAVLLAAAEELAPAAALVLAPPIVHYELVAPALLPVAVVVGGADELTPTSAVESQIRRWPSLCSLEILEGAGHDLGSGSKPVELAAALDRAIERLAARSLRAGA